MTRTASQVLQLFEQNLYPIHEEDWPDSGHEEYVPYDIIAPHEAQALNNHGQTLQRLAERGGLSWGELMAILTDSKWSTAIKWSTAFKGDRSKMRLAVLNYIAERKAVQDENG